jgi:YD repeat-containing protein
LGWHPDHAYEYDGLGRRTTSTFRHDITHTNILDAAGRVLQRNVSAPISVHTLEQFAYDTAGRMTNHTNALGGATTYVEALVNNKRQRTVTNVTDGGQRVETYYRDGRLEKVTGTAAFPVRYDYNRDLLDSAYREFTFETKLSAAGATTPEWTRSYTDAAGRPYKTFYAAASGSPYSESTYNSKNQLIKERDPDGVMTLYTYNVKRRTARDRRGLNANGQVELTGTDRITATLRDVTSYSGYPSLAPGPSSTPPTTRPPRTSSPLSRPRPTGCVPGRSASGIRPRPSSPARSPPTAQTAPAPRRSPGRTIPTSSGRIPTDA